MAQGGYYTKGYIAELEELEGGSKWAPTHDFCQNFSNRFEEAQRVLNAIYLKNGINPLMDLNEDVAREIQEVGIEPIIIDLSLTWALFNNYSDDTRMEEFFEKVALQEWIKVNTYLHSSDKADLGMVITELIGISEAMV